MRKGQIAGQVFIYIVAIVVVGFIIVYGYSAIKTFSKRGEEVEYISLKTSIEASIKSLASDYGSIKRPDISIPGKYRKVCFAEKVSAATAETSGFCNPSNPDKDPIACNVWKTNRSNVFLFPDGTDNFDVGVIDTPQGSDNIICFDVVNNKINLQLKGLGDKVEVSKFG